MSIRLIALPLIAVASVLAGTGCAALAHSPSPAPDTTAKNEPATYLTTSLIGRNEIPGPLGDPNGRAVEVVRIKGDQVSFAIRWQGIQAPTEAHVHLGGAGVNGVVKLDFFSAGIPATANAAVGSITVTDKALLTALRTNPGGFYANLHTANFPGGALRGQLHLLGHAVDLNSVLRGGPLVSLGSGDQEIPSPEGKATGAPGSHATGFVDARRDTVDYAFSWSGISAPTAGHIHQGAVGTDGPVVVPLFASPNGVPASVTGLAGQVTGVSPKITKQIADSPGTYYTNLHTAAFPGGALRGQLFTAGGTRPATMNPGMMAPTTMNPGMMAPGMMAPTTMAPGMMAPTTMAPGMMTPAFADPLVIAAVVTGTQIYACTEQAGGGFAFTQHNVRALLRNGIRHSFVTPNPSPPQWVAPDGSAVTGKVVSTTPNGTGNIPELDLAATQSGRPGGLLSGVTEVLRLNTVGGTAPAGACDPAKQPTAEVPYKADYLFIG